MWTRVSALSLGGIRVMLETCLPGPYDVHKGRLPGCLYARDSRCCDDDAWVGKRLNCGLTWRPTTASSAALAKKMLGCMNTDVAMSRDFLPAEPYENRGEE